MCGLYHPCKSPNACLPVQCGLAGVPHRWMDFNTTPVPLHNQEVGQATTVKQLIKDGIEAIEKWKWIGYINFEIPNAV